MRFAPLFPLIAVASMTHALASPAKRQGIIIVNSPGAISAPADGIAVTAGQTFPFDLAAPIPEWNHCHAAYTDVNVYLLDFQPTTSSLNSTRGFSDYLYFFGPFIVDNIPGLSPPIDPVPPPTLSTPDIGGSYSGNTIYLAVIETVTGCPPNGFPEWAIDSKALVYNE